jgi:hypothetical protein
MRQFILIAATLLISASAQADAPRGLSLASNSEPVTAGQPKAAAASKAETLRIEGTKSEATKTETSKTEAVRTEGPKAETPKGETPQLAERPSANEAAPQPPKADQAKSASDKPEKPKLKRGEIEARVIDELHRHGIYW